MASSSHSQSARHFPVLQVTKTCGHADSLCALTATELCCACMDKRPHSTTGLYDIYVDGRGDVHEGRRWSGYCSACKRTLPFAMSFPLSYERQKKRNTLS